MFVTKASHTVTVDFGCGKNINSLERDGLRRAELCPRHTMKMNTKKTLIPDRSQPGITMTAPTVRYRDVGDKYVTGVPKIKKIRGRENIAVGTWNVRTLRPAGKLEQLTHAMSRYHWNIVGLCEMRWKNFGEMSTDDGHKVYFSGEEGKHEYGVGFLVHKDVVGAVLGCQPVSSRLISIRLRAAPFNITIIQVYTVISLLAVPRRHFYFGSSLLFFYLFVCGMLALWPPV